ncbi:PKD domain-containing protein [Aeromicrobium sp. zg-636]|uniref:PKD domain-containing protein n=1 Tax=Aeromicrobium senzhongii TaxID=2663859 RepID=A0A8I0EXS4_9ACTN|nr:PKD domain-containing protein [Aeromicrobium senzhongii]
MAKDGLSVSVDGSDSSDADGSVESYAWDFGDGASGSGRTASHTYGAAGTYEIRLTVRDDDGATGSVTKSVSVVVPPAEDELAADAFGRTVSGGWGTADRGGAWSVSGGAAAFSVSGAAGHISLAPSHTREARLGSVSTENSVSTAVYSVDQASAGGTLSLTALGRVIGSNEYAARIRLEPSGVVRLQLLRNQTELGGGSVVIANDYTPGTKLNVKVSVRGTSPTTLGAKAWFAGSAEPANWQLTATDSTAGLQAAGVVGVRAALSSVSTVPTTRFNFDSYRVVSGNAPAPNVAPVAGFAVAKDGLSVSVDGSDSSDADGSVESYAWDFGDGASGSGRTASHTYGAAGTYEIRLTVRDDDGATGSVTKSVSVVVPPAEDELAADAFGRTVSGGWGTADRGGAWSVSGGAAAFSVSGAAGHISLAPSHTREARLGSVSTENSVSTAVYSVDQASAGGTLSLTALGRVIGSNEYAARIRLEPSGVVRLQLLRNQTELGGGSVVIANDYTPGTKLNVKVSVRGTSPTTLGAKAWFAGSAEPANWQLTATDSTAGLQAAGVVGVRAALSSVSTVPTTRFNFDSYRVTR